MKGGGPDPSAAAELFPTFLYLIYFRPTTTQSATHNNTHASADSFVAIFIFCYLQLAICKEARLFLEFVCLELHSGATELFLDGHEISFKKINWTISLFHRLKK